MRQAKTETCSPCKRTSEKQGLSDAVLSQFLNLRPPKKEPSLKTMAFNVIFPDLWAQWPIGRAMQIVGMVWRNPTFSGPGRPRNPTFRGFGGEAENEPTFSTPPFKHVGMSALPPASAGRLPSTSGFATSILMSPGRMSASSKSLQMDLHFGVARNSQSTLHSCPF